MVWNWEVVPFLGLYLITISPIQSNLSGCSSPDRIGLPLPTTIQLL
jgi:hypothetical protein